MPDVAATLTRSQPRNKLRSFLRMIVVQPLWAVPFAVFFGTIFGGATWRGYLQAYKLSLIFAVCIGVALWGLSCLVLPRLRHGDGRSRALPLWAEVTSYLVTSILASYVAAVIVHLGVLPGFLGGARQVAISGMFALLFSSLGVGIAYAIVFYRQALERARAEQELTMARRIQRSFLLSQFPEMPRLDVHALNISSRQVSGDFYDVVPAGEDAFLLAVADVAGKGVPAALMTSMLQASLRTQASSGAGVAEILRIINALVYRSTAVHQFATFFLAHVDEPTLTLTYSNAGHNPPLLFRRDGSLVPLDRGGTVVGILEQTDYEQGAIHMEPGDRLVCYTDGASEAMSPAGEQFGEQRLIDLVRALPADLPARAVIERLVEAVRGFAVTEDLGDDVTLLVLRVLEPQPSAAAPEGLAPTRPTAEYLHRGVPARHSGASISPGALPAARALDRSST
jgi:serine phosphatase RsbU (regulator of sigma subunit)